ncbi:helix-turn-helix domain-containing protein [Armatimonas sp.]|uniref:helix-turn-helix domain-containing protein n=1 Tax=Armatimonas sp. TaxID=1872638 RepID=UPI003753A862
MKNKYIGSDFDEFLANEGLLDEAAAIATKRVIAFQIRQEMTLRRLSKTKMAEQMHTSRPALDRLLDPQNRSVTLQTLDRAARVLGKRLRVELVEA